MPQVVILPRLPPIRRTERRQAIKHNIHLKPSLQTACSNRAFTSKPARQVTVNLRSMAARSETSSPGSPAPQEAQLHKKPSSTRSPAPQEAQLHKKPSHLSRVFESSNCQRSQRLIRSARTSAGLRLLITRGNRSRVLSEQAIEAAVGRSPASTSPTQNRAPMPPSISPGGEYTTPSPRRRSHFGHKDRSHNDLRKFVKTQTIFRPSEPFQAAIANPSPATTSVARHHGPLRPPQSTVVTRRREISPRPSLSGAFPAASTRRN
jgi:hypothetical protein